MKNWEVKRWGNTSLTAMYKRNLHNTNKFLIYNT